MKKFTYSFITFLLLTNWVAAKTVPVPSAQAVATSFYQQNSGKTIANVTLAHTGKTVNGETAYYVFNFNDNDGFVIIAAEDVVHPVLGYSYENKFIVPELNTTIDYWMKSRAKEIDAVRIANVPADAQIINEWAGNFSTTSANRPNNSNNSIYTAVAPLMQTTWNQNPNYNSLCPGGSVTGCVATAMAQVMKYWNYPNSGTGSSSYCDCTSMGFAQNYGTLTANYAAATYSWGSMPNSISGSNTAVATLMLHCGISVDMDYSPSGSGAWVITSDNPICAQNSYVNYFKYDPSTIQGLMRTYYTDVAWINILENEINAARPVQYAGYETNGDGHTWIFDGYDASNNFHMNWGWGGYDNGYYSINLMNPNPYTFSLGHEALIGIKPLPYANFSIATNAICVGQTLTLNDLSANSPTSWSYSLPGGTPATSTAQSPTVTYATPGVYTISLITSNATNTSVAMVKTITVSSVPQLTVTAAPICAGSTATINSAGAMAYTLNTNATGNSIMVTPAATTNYTITGFNGCTSSKTVAVVVNPIPNVNATTSTVSVCSGNSATLNVSGATTYSWSDGSTGNNLVVTPTAGTVYAVTGTSGMCSKTSSVSIGYFVSPSVAITGNDSLFCAGQTITLTANGALSYTWSTGSNAPIIMDAPTVATSYTATGSNAAGCLDKAIITQNITALCTGMAQLQNKMACAVYPNPGNGDFTLSISKISAGTTVEVFNALGQLVVKYTPKYLSNAINLMNEANGIYQLRIRDESGLIYQAKILKN